MSHSLPTCLRHLYNCILRSIDEQYVPELVEKPDSYDSIDQFMDSFVPFLENEAIESFKSGLIKLDGSMNNRIELVPGKGSFQTSHSNLALGDLIVFSTHELSSLSSNASRSSLAIVTGSTAVNSYFNAEASFVTVMFHMDSVAFDELSVDEIKYASSVANLFASARVLLRIKLSNLNANIGTSITNWICNLPEKFDKDLESITLPEEEIEDAIYENPLLGTLNDFQVRILRNCMQKVHAREIAGVVGPPGTGKTTWIVAFLLCLHSLSPQKCFLQAASTNVAMVEVAHRALPHLKRLDLQFWILGRYEKLIDEKILPRDLYDYYLPWKVDRILVEIGTLAQCIDMVLCDGITPDVANEIKRLLNEKDMSGHLSLINGLDWESIHLFIYETLVAFSKSLYDFFYKTTLAPIKRLCGEVYSACLSEDFQVAFDRLMDLQITMPKKEKLEDSLAWEAKIIFCTVNGIMQRKIGLSKKEFDAVIVDEAAQVLESESTILLMGNIKSIVLIGDFKQLQGTVFSQNAKELGYELSLFERLINQGLNPGMLQIQYRMHPAISVFPSDTFYDGALVNGRAESQFKKPWYERKEFAPLVFYHHKGTSESKKGLSLVNKEEVIIIYRQISRFLTFCINEGIDTMNLTIGIICPYQSQKRLFTDLFPLFENGLKKLQIDPKSVIKAIDINTVDGFQGQERDIIILSLTRSNAYGGIGFVKNDKRLNVAITRSKFNLWIFGDKRVFSITNSSIGNWSSLVSYCRSSNALLQFENVTVRPIEKVVNEHWLAVEDEINIKEVEIVKIVDRRIDLPTLWDVVIWESLKKQFTSNLFKDKDLCRSFSRVMTWLQNGEFDKHMTIPFCNDENSVIGEVFLGALFRTSRLRERLRLVWTIEIRKGKQQIFLKEVIDTSEVQKAYDQFLKSCKGKSEEYLTLLQPVKNAEGIYVPVSDIVFSQNQSQTLEFRNEYGSTVQLYSLNSATLCLFMDSECNDDIALPYLLDEAQEKAVDCGKQFSLLVGRSGSGKTSVMSEKVFNIFKNLVNSNLEDEVCPELMFLTQSPFLIKYVSDEFERRCQTFLKANGLFDQFKSLPDRFRFCSFLDFLLYMDETLGSNLFHHSDESSIIEGIKMMRASARKKQMEKVSPKNHISYNHFEVKYYKHADSALRKKFSCTVIFSEIMTFIKGSEEFRILSRDEYISLASSRMVLETLKNPEDRAMIYDFYKSYENLKAKCNEFDLPDLALLVFRELEAAQAEALKPFDYLMVDEVQDLLPVQISLLSKVIHPRDSVVAFCGDMAQAITEGNRFRFSRIKDIFFHQEQAKIKEFFLGKNYRSQSTIIELANRIVSWIKRLFENELDKLPVEESSEIGLYKPTALTEISSNSELFDAIFSSECKELGADQCILVSNPSERENLSQILKSRGFGANILTIIESKGLEFEDVILYNIFSASATKSRYRVLMQVDPERFSNLNLPDFNPKLHYSLCRDLKELYVAVTRAKKKVLIFDEDKALLKIFCDVADDAISTDQKEIMHDGVSFAVKGSSEDWIKRGNQYMNQGLYEYAHEAFVKAGDDELTNLSYAHVLESRVDKELSGRSDDSESEVPESKEAGNLFKSLGRIRQAADVYMKGFCWQSAAECYLREEKYVFYLHCLIKGKLYDEAFTFATKKAGSYSIESDLMDSVLLQLASVFLHDKKKLNDILSRVASFESGKEFLEEKKMFDLLIEYCSNRQKWAEAAEAAQKIGRSDEALVLLEHVLTESHDQELLNGFSNLFFSKFMGDFNFANPVEIKAKYPENVKISLTSEKEIMIGLVGDHGKLDVNSDYLMVKFLSVHLKLLKMVQAPLQLVFNNLLSRLQTMDQYFEILCQAMKILDYNLESERCRSLVEMFFGYAGKGISGQHVRIVGWFAEFVENVSESQDLSDSAYRKVVKTYLVNTWFDYFEALQSSFMEVVIGLPVEINRLVFGNQIVPYNLVEDILRLMKAMSAEERLKGHGLFMEILGNRDGLGKRMEDLLSVVKGMRTYAEDMCRYSSWASSFPFRFEGHVISNYDYTRCQKQIKDVKAARNDRTFLERHISSSSLNEEDLIKCFKRIMNRKIGLCSDILYQCHDPFDFLEVFQDLVLSSCLLIGKNFSLAKYQFECFVQPWYKIFNIARSADWLSGFLKKYLDRMEECLKTAMKLDYYQEQWFTDFYTLPSDAEARRLQFFAILLLTACSYFQLDKARLRWYSKFIVDFVKRVNSLLQVPLPDSLTTMKKVTSLEDLDDIRVACLNILGCDGLAFKGFGPKKATVESNFKYEEKDQVDTVDEALVSVMHAQVTENIELSEFVKARLRYFLNRRRVGQLIGPLQESLKFDKALIGLEAEESQLKRLSFYIGAMRQALTLLFKFQIYLILMNEAGLIEDFQERVEKFHSSALTLFQNVEFPVNGSELGQSCEAIISELIEGLEDIDYSKFTLQLDLLAMGDFDTCLKDYGWSVDVSSKKFLKDNLCLDIESRVDVINTLVPACDALKDAWNALFKVQGDCLLKKKPKVDGFRDRVEKLKHCISVRLIREIKSPMAANSFMGEVQGIIDAALQGLDVQIPKVLATGSKKDKRQQKKASKKNKKTK